MNELLKLIKMGDDYFGSSSRNTDEFNAFFRSFKKRMAKEVESVDGTDYEIAKGHFYLSGFFKTSTGQLYYFSLSDVRWNWGEPQLLYRTAEHNRDWTGGMNQYVNIGDGMVQKMNLK